MHRKPNVPRFSLPSERGATLPPIGAFGRDDFYRARYFTALIERYANKHETKVLVEFARERRVPAMSFADTLEAVARYIHNGGDDAVARMIENAKKPREQTEAEVAFNEHVREAVKRHGADSTKTFEAMVDSLRTLFPNATKERIMGALECGNSADGFRPAAVIEAMFLTEQPKEA